MKIFTKSPFEIPRDWIEIVQDYDIISVPVKNKQYDTCEDCAFRDSILCMGLGNCTGIIFKVHCDD